MTNLVFDSYAMIAHFKKEKGHEQVSELLSEISAGDKAGFISLINLGEIYYILHRTYGQKHADQSVKIVQQMPLEIVGIDLNLTINAAKYKAVHRLSYADAFAAALTKSKRGLLVTGDKEFKSLEGEIKVKFI